MPRVGYSIEEGVSSSLFRFEEGRGQIVNAVVAVDQILQFDARCGIKLTVQRLGRDGRPTDDEPIEEFLSCGPATKFHPGNAASPDEEDPEDLGGDVGTEGNMIVAVANKGIDRKTNLYHFGKSAQERGLIPALLNGYAPYLIGMDADFDRLKLEKSAGSVAKQDPTCLIVKATGNIYNLSEMNRKVKNAAGAAGVATGTGATTRTAVGSTGTAAGRKANGLAKLDTVAAASAGAAPEPAEYDHVVEAKAITLLSQMPGKKETATTRQKMGSRMVMAFATSKPPVAPDLHTPVLQLINDADWLNETLTNLGWTVNGDQIVIPAAG